MLLFVGLGNPGSRYAGNRHNIGFMAVEAIARRHDIGPFRRKFQGLAVEGMIARERVLLLLPGTYMNESGPAGGGAASHNGLRSITAHVGNDYKRVRIGIGKPDVKELVPMHVLGDFAKHERAWVQALYGFMADHAGLLAAGKDASFQNKVHLAMQAKGFGESGAKDE